MLIKQYIPHAAGQGHNGDKRVDRAVAKAVQHEPAARHASPWVDVSPTGEELRFQDFLTYRLGRLGTLTHREVTVRYLSGSNLTLPEWRLLARLSAHSSLEMRALSRINLMDKAAISRAVDGLQAKGYVARHVDPANAKRRIVAVTPAGRRVVRRVMPAAQREQAELLRVLTPEERQWLDLALDKLTRALLERSAAHD